MPGNTTEKWTPDQWKKHVEQENKARQSKFKNIPAVHADGTKFQSQFECRYYNRLKLLQQAGEVQSFERQVRYELAVNGVLICDYLLDFKITFADGHVEYVDTKSTATVTPIYKMKKNLMLAIHGITLTEYFDDELRK